MRYKQFWFQTSSAEILPDKLDMSNFSFVLVIKLPIKTSVTDSHKSSDCLSIYTTYPHEGRKKWEEMASMFFGKGGRLHSFIHFHKWNSHASLCLPFRPLINILSSRHLQRAVSEHSVFATASRTLNTNAPKYLQCCLWQSSHGHSVGKFTLWKTCIRSNDPIQWWASMLDFDSVFVSFKV